MRVIPAIDLKEGKVVRLRQGDFNQRQVYQDDCLTLALNYQRQGAKAIHIVDLDGAKTGQRLNLKVIEQIVNNLSIPIQLGGGIRSYDEAKALLLKGSDRVVVGTMAFEAVDDLKKLINEFKERIVVALDVKNEEVLIHGWQTKSQQNIYDFSVFLETLGARIILVTDVAKDGMMKGPNITLYERLKTRTRLKVIASGGVSSLEDLKRLKAIEMDAVVVGKALLDGCFTYQEAETC